MQVCNLIYENHIVCVLFIQDCPSISQTNRGITIWKLVPNSPVALNRSTRNIFYINSEVNKYVPILHYPKPNGLTDLNLIWWGDLLFTPSSGSVI